MFSTRINDFFDNLKQWLIFRILIHLHSIINQSYYKIILYKIYSNFSMHCIIILVLDNKRLMASIQNVHIKHFKIKHTHYNCIHRFAFFIMYSCGWDIKAPKLTCLGWHTQYWKNVYGYYTTLVRFLINNVRNASIW